MAVRVSLVGEHGAHVVKRAFDALSVDTFRIDPQTLEEICLSVTPVKASPAYPVVSAGHQMLWLALIERVEQVPTVPEVQPQLHHNCAEDLRTRGLPHQGESGTEEDGVKGKTNPARAKNVEPTTAWRGAGAVVGSTTGEAIRTL